MKWTSVLQQMRQAVQIKHLATWRPERWFLVMAVVFGGFMAVVTPPFQVPDEAAHFYRAYQISQGHLMAQRVPGGSGGVLPTSVVASANINASMPTDRSVKVDLHRQLHYLTLPLQPTQTVPVRFENTALYSPVPYIPQAAVIFVSRHLGLSPLAMLYLGRFAVLAVWISLVFWAVKLADFAKWPLVVLALTPLSLFVSASLSSDVMANGLAFLAVGLLIYYRKTRAAITPWRLAGLGALSLGLGLVKLPYCFIPLIFLAVPRECFRRFSVKAVIISLGLAGVAVAAAGLWYKGAQHLYQPYRVDLVVNPAAQVHGMLTHPLSFLHVLFNTYLTTMGDPYILGFIGFLGSFEYGIPYLILLIGLALLLLAFLTADDAHNVLSARLRLALGVLAAALALIISALLYVSWSGVGAPAIDGIQARYFIPIAPLLVLALSRRRLVRLVFPGQNPAKLFVPGVGLYLTAAFCAIIARYYIH